MGQRTAGGQTAVRGFWVPSEERDRDDPLGIKVKQLGRQGLVSQWQVTEQALTEAWIVGAGLQVGVDPEHF